jgi:hypothetical protein
MSKLAEHYKNLKTRSGDHDKFAHYAEQSEITRAYVESVPITSLCGKIWIPFGDAARYPVCPACKQIMDAMFVDGRA